MAKGRSTTLEEINKIIELYRAGYSYPFIEKEVDLKRKAIGLVIKRAINRGELIKRHPTIRMENVKEIHYQKRGLSPEKQEQIEIVRKMYQDGMDASDIARRLNLSLSTVSRDIKYLCARGEVEARDRVRKIRHTKEEGTPATVIIKTHYKKVPSTLAEGEVIKCTPAVSKSCVYGVDLNSAGLCRYSRVTGECRSIGKDGCSWQACNKYSKISKSNPRLKGVDDRC